MEKNSNTTCNELKIELYPLNKPFDYLEKDSIKKILTKNILAHSLNINDKISFINSKTPILNGFYIAHTNHFPIRIKPDDIWLLILQSFSNHVNANSEKLRNMFVDFDGKKNLIIDYPLNDINQVNKEILENFTEQINEQIKNFIGKDLLDILTPSFTTTDYNSTIISKITIIGTFKKYFKFEIRLSGCGIPYLILEGTSEDYKKIIKKAEKLKKYDFEWYINRIIPLLEKMVEAKNNNIDIEFFKDIIQDKTETELARGISGIGRNYEEIDYIRGWFLKFFAYYDDGVRFMEDSIKGKNFDKLANQMLNVPIKIQDKVNKKTYDLEYNVGFVGCKQNKNYEIFPVSGWFVSYNREEENIKEKKYLNVEEEKKTKLEDEKNLEKFLENNEDFRVFCKMLKLGVPITIVRQKAEKNGFDMDIFEEMLMKAQKVYPDIR